MADACYYCTRPATLLCDGFIAKRQTCDRPLCSECRTSGGVIRVRGGGRGFKVRTATIDFCPECAPSRGRKGESFVEAIADA